MSYMRSSYKSSSYRFTTSSSTDGSTSRYRSDDGDDSSFSVSRSARSFNYEDTSPLGTSTRQSRLTSRYSTDNDYEIDTGSSRTTSSRYKSLLSSDNDEFSGRSYGSRYINESDSTSSRTLLGRYSSLESGADDPSLSFTSTRRTGRLSYLDDESDNFLTSTSSRSYTRRLTSDSFDEPSYKVTTPSEEESRPFSAAFSSVESSDRRRYQGNSMSRSLARLESREGNQIYEVILDYKPPFSATDEICLKEGQEVVVLSKDKPHKWKVRTRRSKNFTSVEEGFAPSAYLKVKNETVENEPGTMCSSSSTEAEAIKDEQAIQKDLKKKKDMIVRELIETEEDLVRDMQFVQRTYIRQSESSITPKEIKAVKDDIFNCFKELLEFHRDVLLKNFHNLSKEPTKIGTLFIRLESDFENHTKYCQNMDKALSVLDDNSDVSEFFNNYAVKIRDEKTLADHLKLPFQRLNDYQLLLRELSKHLSRMEENTDDLDKAIKLISSIPEAETETEQAQERTEPVDFKASEFNLPNESSEKLSKLLKNVLQAKDYFDVIDNEGKLSERFIFLFKTRMFLTEVNKNISENQRSYNVKKIIKLPDIEALPDSENACTILVKSKDASDLAYPIRFRGKTEEQASTWLRLMNTSPTDVEDDDKSDRLLEENLFASRPVSNTDENNNKIKNAVNTELEEAREPPVATNPIDQANEPSSSLGDHVSAQSESSSLAPEPVTSITEKLADQVLSTSSEPIQEKAAKSETYEIVQPLKAVTKHVSETATLQCKVSPGTSNVQWLKDNKILTGSNYKTYKQDDTYFLELSNLSSDDAGVYTFIASNSKESVASSSTLNVLSVLGDSRPTSPGGSFLPHPPKFKVKLKDTELLEGSTARFELIVRGLPIPSLSFFKNDKPLKEDDHLKILFQSKEVFEIMIENVKKEDTGVYKCVAINTEGQDETSGRITVSSDKNVFWGLEEEDSKNMIESPRPRSPAFKWFKDGKEFEASERFQVQFDDQEDTIALIFQHVKPDDAGLYTCVASTGSEKISCSAELNVQGMVRELPRAPIAPKIVKDLTNITATKGESVAILEAQISGYPKPKVEWFKGNELLQADNRHKMLLEGEENYALAIKNVNEEDAGCYKLKATNELGSVESDAQLTIVKKPEFIKIKDKIEVSCNDSLIIEASYDAVPPPQVKWVKDGEDIKKDSRIKVVEKKGVTQLVIDCASSSDAGMYQCQISNDLGSAKQSTQVLVKSPPQFMKKLEAIQVVEGEVATFWVQSTGASQIEFYKGSELLTNRKTIQIKNEAEGKSLLIINDAQVEDEGKYKCRIKNDYGYAEDDAELTIIKKKSTPEFKEKLQDMTVALGDENVRLAVKFDGEPTPVCKWFHNGQEISGQDKQFAIVNDKNGSALVIPKVMHEHQGVYECKSENVCGTAQSSSKLTVNCAPYVVKHLDSVDTALGLDVKLTAIIKGNPNPNIKWYVNDQEITMDKRRRYSYAEASAEYTLYISKLQNEDIGIYKIEAENVFGKCASSSKVELVSKPLFTKVLKNIVAKPMESNIELVVQLDSQSSKPLVKWFKDDVEITDNNQQYKKVEDKLDNSYKLVVLKATEEMVGKYKCIASNDYGSTETAARFDVIAKPKFIKGLTDLQVMEGANVSMTVQVAGFPKPEVFFYKDGQDVSTEATIVVKKEMDDIYVLEIENIRIIMSGEYECRIHNEAGEASSKGVITVNGKPQVIKDLTDQTISVGEDLALEVILTGNPSPQVKWFVNGKETPGQERVLLDSREEVYRLKIPNAAEEDSGVYQCEAVNKFGEAKSQPSHVQVVKQEKAPVFTKRLDNARVVVDDNARFVAQVTALPEATVSWCHNGVPLKPTDKVDIKSEGENHVLVLKNLQIADSGVIECRAQNTKGYASDTAKLSVEEPTLPSISGLNSLSVVDGVPVTLEATVTGFPKPNVMWYKDGTIVDTEIAHSEPLNNKYWLHFQSFSPDFAGKYTCSATNSAGEALESATIDICGKKPVFLKELEESIVMSVEKDRNKLKLGQNAIFETVVVGTPTPEVTWLKNDTPLRPSSRVSISSVDDDHRLEIKEITKDDVARYTCKAINDYGEALSVCLLKFLNEPHEPIIIKPLEDTKVEEGEALKLFCKVDGEPMPAVRWLKDDQLVDSGDRVKISSRGDGSASLVIEPAVIADTGHYQLQAENAKGSASSAANATVVKPQRPPQFTEPLKEEIKVEYNSPLLLEAIVFGLPKPSVQWLKDGKPVPKEAKTKLLEDGKCQLSIDQSKTDHSGNYTLKATNASGEATSVSNVKVMPEPYAPLVITNLPVKVQVLVGEPIKLQAKIEAYPLPQITWLKDKTPLAPSDSVHMVTKSDGNIGLTIDSAQPFHQGEYVVKAENPVGEISTSTQVQVRSPSNADLLVKPLPEKLEVVSGQPLVLSATVEKAPSSEVFWLKDGMPVKTAGKTEIQENDGQFSLVVAQADPKDAGLYTLMVKSDTTTLQSQSQVQVLDKPQVVKPDQVYTILQAIPSELNISSGEDLKLDMKVNLEDIPSDCVRVYKDGVPLKPCDTSKVFIKNGEVQFIQDKCNPCDSGTYKIEIDTPSGSIDSSCVVKVADKNKPKFGRELGAIQVTSGYPCRMECTIDGNPSDFNIAWYKDGEEILPNEHYGLVKEPNGTIALLIDSFSAKDVGAYQVKVSNNSGVAESTCQASIKEDRLKEKPVIIEPLQDTCVEENSPLVLQCKVAPASLPIKCTWFANGKEIKESDSIKFLTFPNGTIMAQFQNIQAGQSGNFKVVVNNDFGESSSQAKVTVKPREKNPPKVLKELQSTTLIAGEPGLLEMQVEGGLEGDIQFLHDGKPVLPTDRVHIQHLPDGRIRLTFDNVLLEDQGEYTAIFQNNDGQVQSKAPVIVKSKPIIIKNLKELSVKEGCAGKFEVQIKANPEPKISWTKNGNEIDPSSRNITMQSQGNNTYVLTFDKCGFRDIAEYGVVAVNELGEASSNARLNVISSDQCEECAPTLIESLHDLTTKQGDTFTLKAKVSCHPVPEIVWKKNGHEINQSDLVRLNFDGSNIELTVLNVDPSHFGTYELSIKNHLGEASCKANVTALKQSAPRFVKKLSDMECNVKASIRQTCRVEGNPTPKVSWYFNGKIIEPGLKFNVFEENGEHVLTISNTSEVDSGLYECVATNELGSDKTSANVHFKETGLGGEAAQFLSKLQDFDVLPGGTARFTACVVGSPKPQLKWFKDEKEIVVDGDKYTLEYQDNGMIKFEVTHVSTGDLGKYRCCATNAYGSDNSIAQLNFETMDGLDRMNKSHKSQKSQRRALDADDVDYKTSGLPVPLSDKPQITKMTDNSLTLLWLPSVPEQPRFPVSYVIEFCKPGDGVWTVYQTDIKDTRCEVTNLEPFQDYSFRVRVENKFGVSDPSPSVTAFRSNLQVKEEPKEFKPEDFDIKHIPREKIAEAPKFLREEESFTYGICGQPVTLEFWVYGYPDPNITWMFGDQKIEHSDKYNFLQDRGGRTCLFINKMSLSDVGYYTCIATNEHGEERRTIKLLNAEPPVFTKRFEETTITARNHLRLECSVKGIPEPTIKWFKDFQPLHDTSRIKVMWESPDHATLILSDAITRDSGLYSCTATNFAGSTTTAAFVHVKDAEITYEKYPFTYGKSIKPKTKPIEQFYDIGDELGRGTQGIVYHSVERSTGNSFATKMMHGTGEMKQYMMGELEAMNQLGGHERLVRLHDAFASTPHSLSLITDLCGGGTLLDHLLNKGSLTENEVAHYIRQILEGLQYMHFKNIGHFGLTIGDLLMDRINGPDIKICDFGLAQRVIPGTTHYVEFGQPEFVSPEIVSKNSVTFTTDAWSVGIITYILLTGISPFLAENDRATLHNIQNKKLDLSDNSLSHISDDGKDFLHKILNYDPKDRLDVKGALNHQWLKRSFEPEKGNQLNIFDNLRDYKSKYNRWYQNASCKRYYRRRALHSCYTHPSRMIYPPDEPYSPIVSPDREIKKYTKTVSPFENIYPPMENSAESFSSESHYQSGPDTYLLQLRDTDFPARIRRYLRIAATSSPSIAANLKQAHWGGRITASMTGNFSQVSIKERRKFTDVMDEEIHDEMRGNTIRNKPMRLVRELGTSSYAYGQLKSIRREAKLTRLTDQCEDDFTMPFFREKLKDTSFQSGDDVVFSCYAVGTPEPTYTWFRNDSILIESSRVEVKRTDDGRCQLKLKPAREYDVAVYKCIARNSQGSVLCRARLDLGGVAAHLAPPMIKDGSAHSLLLTWHSPKFLGNAHVQQYRLEFKRADETTWNMVDAEVKQEFYLVTDLEADQTYQFRISALNKFGWSDPSGPSEIGKTLALEENKVVAIPPAMQFVCNIADELNSEELLQKIDYSKENNPVPLIKSDFKELYDFKSIIACGKFSVISRAYVKDGTRQTLACKCVMAQSETESSVSTEYDMMKSLAHERIAQLHYANRDGNVFSLAAEMLSGLNVLTYLCRKQTYSEEVVCKIICQVLDGIEYLHFRGIGLLELQPDNVLVVNESQLQIKLTDFASARRITSTSNRPSLAANPEYIAPELIRNEEVSLPYTDIWTVGVLTYILLSGFSPFQGEDLKETAQNVVFVRYLFDRLYPEVTQEAIRFLLTVFKLTPHKRPTIEECFDNKWLIPNEFMIRKRQIATFSSARLSAFAEQFFASKSASHSRLLDLLGLSQ